MIGRQTKFADGCHIRLILATGTLPSGPRGKCPEFCHEIGYYLNGLMLSGDVPFGDDVGDF